MEYITNDGTPCTVKAVRTVWSGGKVVDNIKDLPIAIFREPRPFGSRFGVHPQDGGVRRNDGDRDTRSFHYRGR